MEDKTEEITDNSLLKTPFTLYFGLNKLPIEDIYDKSKKFKDSLKDYKIGNKSFLLEFSKINEHECEMSINFNNSFEYSCNLLFEPLKLNLEELNLSTKDILLYSPNQIKQLIHFYNSDYIFLDQDKNNIDENTDYKSLKKITINKIEEFGLNNNNFIEAKKKAIDFFENIASNKQKNTIDIYPFLLSFNFYEIFVEHLKGESFKLILNEDRKNFIQKIENFLSSSKRFLWIVGSDGIGKTISLMYFSLMNPDNVFYINLKFLHKNSDKIKEYLTNELIRPFYLRKDNINDEKSFKKTKNDLNYVLREIFNLSQDQKKLEPIYKFWIYLKRALNTINLNFCCGKLIIILDQYKDISLDKYDYSYINNFIDYINTMSYKLIISTSVNNSNIQSSFYSNIDYFNFNDNKEKEIYNDDSDSENINMIEEDYDVIEECNFYQDILNKSKQKKVNENKNNINISVNSKFCLNNKYKDDTLKIYYSSLVSGKDLIQKFNKEEINCFKNFNYNLKYIYKYIKFKSDFENKKNKISQNINEINKNKIEENNNNNDNGINTENKKNDNNDIGNDEKNENVNNTDKNSKISNNDNQINTEINNINNLGEKTEEKVKKEDNILEIIEEFYEECHNHIQQKIKGFYSMSENESVTIEEYKRLNKLRDIIFNKDLFTIEEIRKEIKHYPAKYLNIFTNSTTNIESPLNKDIQAFQIKYSNLFCKLAVNKLLNELEDEMQALNRLDKGSGGGINFENNVINSILLCKQQIFGHLNYKKRKVFSLVGKTKNSKITVQQHRDEEKNNKLFKFYNINEYSEIIDDIDYKEGAEELKLKGNLYLIKQASKTGRSFDFAILKKSENTNDWFLYLFQATINKVGELKKKDEYIVDSSISESYLNSLYKIKIKKRYLIFVIPYYSYDSSFTSVLEEKKFHYIFYKSCQFYDKTNNLISNLNFVEAEIIKKNEKILDKEQIKIEKSLNAWEITINSYLKRKRERNLSDYFTKNLSKIKGRGIKLNISKEIKNKIFEAIYENYSENKYELLFIGNCKINKIKSVFEKNTLLIFFKIKGAFHFYFGSYYKLVEDTFVKIDNDSINEKEIKNKPNYKSNKINLTEIDEKVNLCFCYKILGENN